MENINARKRVPDRLIKRVQRCSPYNLLNSMLKKRLHAPKMTLKRAKPCMTGMTAEIHLH